MTTTEELLRHFLVQQSVCTDTRKLEPGDIFIALKGPRFNANSFAAQALAEGAAFVVVDEPEVVDVGDPRYLLVENGLKALQDLALAYRRSLSQLTVLGLTGSNGKTTTKELIASVLSQAKKVAATKGNFNNHIGVPLTLLAIPVDTEIAIIEMGANQPGDIKELAELAEPDMGLITNVGQAHLEKLGSLEGVRQTKGALFEFVSAHDGHLFVNQADHRVRQTAGTYPRQISYGTQTSDLWLGNQQVQAAGMELTIEFATGRSPFTVHTQLTGDYNAINVLAAVTVGYHLGLTDEQIQAGIYAYLPQNNRSQLMQIGGKTLWLDAYNANPSSMEAAIRHIFANGKGNIGLIIGDMFELGDQSAALHQHIGELINSFQPTWVVGVGNEIQHALTQIAAPTFAYEETEALAPDLDKLLAQVDTILMKGSRGVALEKILPFWPKQS